MGSSVNPKYSFIVTCYNYAAYLPKALDSILNQQNFDAWEAICVDDGSTDDTPNILGDYSERDPRFRVITIKNSGLEKACNTGILSATAPYVIRLDADDFLMSNYLDKMNKAIELYLNFSFYYVKEYVEYYNDKKRIHKSLPRFDAEEIFCRGDFFASGTVYTKTHIEQLGLFPTDQPNCGLENYAIILALLNSGYKGYAVSGTGFSYRRHEENMSTLKRQKIIAYGEKLLQKYGRRFQTNKYHPYNLVL